MTEDEEMLLRHEEAIFTAADDITTIYLLLTSCMDLLKHTELHQLTNESSIQFQKAATNFHQK